MNSKDMLYNIVPQGNDSVLYTWKFVNIDLLATNSCIYFF